MGRHVYGWTYISLYFPNLFSNYFHIALKCFQIYPPPHTQTHTALPNLIPPSHLPSRLPPPHPFLTALSFWITNMDDGNDAS